MTLDVRAIFYHKELYWEFSAAGGHSLWRRTQEGEETLVWNNSHF
jgi:hypothetical protein